MKSNERSAAIVAIIVMVVCAWFSGYWIGSGKIEQKPTIANSVDPRDSNIRLIETDPKQLGDNVSSAERKFTTEELMAQIDGLQRQLSEMTSEERGDLERRLANDPLRNERLARAVEIGSRGADVTTLEEKGSTGTTTSDLSDGQWIVRSIGTGSATVVRPDNPQERYSCSADAGLKVGDRVVLRRRQVPGMEGHEDPKIAMWQWVAERP